MNPRKSLSIVFAAMVVLTAIISAPTGYIGVASASHECSFGDTAVETGLAMASGGTSLLSDASGYEQEALGCDVFHGDREASDVVDKVEQRQEIVQRASTTDQHADVVRTSQANYLQDTQSVARLEGQEAYYRALENGDSRSAARAEARSAVRDYYAVKQIQLVESWNVLIDNWDSYESLADSSDLPNDFVTMRYEGSDGTTYQITDFRTTTGNNQLVNGSSIEAVGFTDAARSSPYEYVYPWSDASWTNNNNDGDDAEHTLYVANNNGSYTTVSNSELPSYFDDWSRIQTQSQQTIDNLDTFINQTYDSYQSGDVDTSQLFGASMFTRSFTPNESFQSWSTLALSQRDGVSPPENLSTVGEMNVTFNGTTHQGLLLIDNQDVTTVETNRTYYTSNFSVNPQLVTDSEWLRIGGEFTVTEIEDADGNQINNYTVSDVDYNTSNTSEYRELMDELDEVRAELEAREQQTDDSGILGGFLSGGNAGMIGVAILAGGALLLLSNRQDGVTVVDGRK